MTSKRILCESRRRRMPSQFSWVDQRLVFEGHLARCDAQAAALYLFLVTVADVRGLSYWGDARVAQMLSCPIERLVQARDELVRAGLIAYASPLYQVLALDEPAPPAGAPAVVAAAAAASSSSTAPEAGSASVGAERQAIREQLARVRANLTGGPR